MKTILRTAVVVSIVVAGLAGCGARGEPGVRPPQTTLIVENRSFSEMRIYALVSTQRVRLGNVSGNSTARLRIPDHLVAGGRELRFVVDALAGPRATTAYSLFVTPGEDVRLMVPATLR